MVSTHVHIESKAFHVVQYGKNLSSFEKIQATMTAACFGLIEGSLFCHVNGAGNNNNQLLEKVRLAVSREREEEREEQEVNYPSNVLGKCGSRFETNMGN